jgi:hypothetical protein
MQRGDQSNFVPADVEDGEFSHLVGLGEYLPQSGKVREAALADNPYQRASDELVAGCFSANSFRRLRVMTCMFRGLRGRQIVSSDNAIVTNADDT